MEGLSSKIYIPIIKQIAGAGWEPVTGATSNPIVL